MYTAVFCWLIIRTVTHMHTGSRERCAKLSVLSYEELEFGLSGEMPLYFPPHPHPIPAPHPTPKTWQGWGELIQLSSSQERSKNAIPPSKPPPSPSPPVLCSLFLLIYEERFKKISHSLIKKNGGGEKCWASKFPAVIYATSTTRKTQKRGRIF